MAAALTPDSIVVGPDKMATGAGAKDALAGWQLDGSTVFQRSREIHQARWGFVQANLDRPRPGGKGVDRIVGQLFAVPVPDGTWSIVVAQYAAQ
ncbi:MAG TPA: hypothetical protein VH165_02105 [Kofleriaceae bacterium]|nr:hypothetical protein [Kofleriaceae bacterium]